MSNKPNDQENARPAFSGQHSPEEAPTLIGGLRGRMQTGNSDKTEFADIRPWLIGFLIFTAGATLAAVIYIPRLFPWIHVTVIVYAAVVIFVVLIALVIVRQVRGPEDEALAESVRRLSDPVHPDRRTRKLLGAKHEWVLKYTRRHPICCLVWWITMGLASLAALGSLLLHINGWVILVFWSSCMLVAGYFILEWLREKFCLTNVRLILFTGLWTEKYPTMPLSKMTDVTLEIPWHSRLLSALRIVKHRYGNFVFESAGQKQGIERVDSVPQAFAIQQLIMSQLHGPSPEEINED